MLGVLPGLSGVMDLGAALWLSRPRASEGVAVSECQQLPLPQSPAGLSATSQIPPAVIVCMKEWEKCCLVQTSPAD